MVAGRRGERRDLNILDRRDQAATFVAPSYLCSFIQLSVSGEFSENTLWDGGEDP